MSDHGPAPIATASSPDLDAGLHASPELYPLCVAEDGARMRFLKLSEAEYRAASFLDERLHGPEASDTVCPLNEVEASARRIGERYHFIFHIGHVGSTLISRLLDEHAELFCIREPERLRVLADRYLQCLLAGHVEDLDLGHDTELLMRLMSRVWRPEQTAVVKATSFVSGMAYGLMERAPPATRAILMVVTPLTYLRSIIGRGGSMTELQMMAPQRARRLALRLNAPALLDAPLSDGEMLAMSWLCEVMALGDAARVRPSAALWLDFDVFLGDPPAALRKVLRHLGVDADARRVSAALNAPVMRQYSKDPSHAFGMDQRRQIMREAHLAHGAEIDRGMTWLGQLARTYPAVRKAVETVAAHSAAL